MSCVHVTTQVNLTPECFVTLFTSHLVFFPVRIHLVRDERLVRLECFTADLTGQDLLRGMRCRPVPL